MKICDRHGIGEPIEAQFKVHLDEQTFELCHDCFSMVFNLISDPNTMVYTDLGEMAENLDLTVN